jgi:hypothetical protein
MKTNSPDLWPRRPFILVFLPIFGSFFQSSLHPLSPFYFLDRSGAYCEAPRGGSADHVLGPIELGRPSNFDWNSILFSSPFSSMLDRSWLPKWIQNRRKSFKNQLRSYPSILNRFRHHFLRFPLWFSTPVDTQHRAETINCYSFSYLYRFFFELSSGIDFKPFGLYVGMLLESIFNVFRIKKSIDELTFLFYVFSPCWDDSGVQNRPQPPPP